MNPADYRGPDRDYWRVLRADALAESWVLRYDLVRPRRFPALALIHAADPARLHVVTLAENSLPLEARHTRTDEAVGALLGVGRATIRAWLHREATLDEHAADRYASRLGLHPCDVWPDWWHGLAALDTHGRVSA
jgi:hypothetical protein